MCDLVTLAATFDYLGFVLTGCLREVDHDLDALAICGSLKRMLIRFQRKRMGDQGLKVDLAC